MSCTLHLGNKDSLTGGTFIFLFLFVFIEEEAKASEIK